MPEETKTAAKKPDPLAMLDYADATPEVVKAQFAGLDIGAVLKDPKNFLLLIDLINKIKGWISRPKPIDPPTTGGGGTVIPPPPPPPDPEAPPPREKVITSLRARFYHISRKNKDISKAEFDAIVARDSPLQAGDRVHMDCTPYDQFGIEVAPGDPALEQLVERYTDEDGNPQSRLRLRWLQPHDGIGEITNEYDDYGMTPVYKVPKWAKVGEQYELGSFQLEFTPAGTSRPIVSNVLHSLRVRPWQE